MFGLRRKNKPIEATKVPTEEPKSFEDDLKGYDLEIISDFDGDQLNPSSIRNVWWIQTMEDRSVGIFPLVISPHFTYYDHAIEWWEAMKEIFNGGVYE
jgi:hypothetical protein